MTDIALNLSALDALIGDDQSFRNSILEEFKSSSVPFLEDLEEAVQAQQADVVQALAHRLKSSSRTIGAEPLGSVCEQLETAAPDGNWQQIQGLQQQLRLQLDAVNTAIAEISRC